MNIRTNLRAGECDGDPWLGRVNQVGDGYHGQVFGDDGKFHSFSPDYTEFLPHNQALFPGEPVIFAFYGAGSSLQGKVSCIKHE